MRQNSKVEGTKIAQAAKDLNVTSVTIRRYLIEFNIPTTSDENGIKVLPPQAMSELQEVRRLKEEGLTNPKVLEFLEELRTKGDEGTKADKPRAKKISKPVEKEVVKDDDEDEEEAAPAAPAKKVAESKTADKRKPVRRVAKEKEEAEPSEAAESETDTAEADAADAAEQSEAADAADGQGEDNGLDASGEPRAKHSLTCQTCGKVFEHMNPRLRDCLDCYRTKRKERRRGGSERHKNVIQHPLAQQAASKAPVAPGSSAPAAREPREIREPREPREIREPREPREIREPRDSREHREPREREPREREPREPREREFAETAAVPSPVVPSPVVPAPYQAPVIQRGQVRNYRKAIEETRQITGSLKRRLERPDLPEGERRWLEQIYAYQLILHQGWRHLSEYKSATVSQGRTNNDE
jgi:DNA-binding transcriptional MerR regulator